MGILKLRRRKSVVCRPPWSSCRRHNHRRHKLGKRNNGWQIKGLICFRRWLCMSVLQTCTLLKGKQQLALVPPSVSGSHLPGGSFPPSLTGTSTLPQPCAPSLLSNFRLPKLCRWGGSPSEGALSKRHAHPSYLNKLQQALPCTSKSSSHPPRPMPQDKCHLSSH